VSVPVVYDTMVFLQAASRPQRTHTLFQAIYDERVSLHISAALLAEIRDVFMRPRVRAKFPALTDYAVHAFIADVLAHARLVDPVPSAFTWPHHPDDDHLFNAAIAARARYLVTWETRILKLGTESTPIAKQLRHLAPHLAIVTPRELAGVLFPPTASES
jgi:putative PIN family toxin of toxin-antitoxin system